MAITRHVHETYIKATADRVWNAIVDPSFTQRYFSGARFTSPSVSAGAAFSYRNSDDSDAVVGEIVEAEPTRRLVMTWSIRTSPELAAEPPSRVEWELAPAGDGITRLTLRHVELASSPLTWAEVHLGWVGVLDGMKTLIETGEPLGPIVELGDAEPPDVDGDWHRAQGIAANNATWDLLGRPAGERTADDDDEMTRRAYAAAFHWQRATGAGPANAARAEWLLSRTWVTRGKGDLALQHAERCAAHCEAGRLGDFDLAYAHEARARAFACLARLDEARTELAAARAVPIADDEDRGILEADLAGEPWFGLEG